MTLFRFIHTADLHLDSQFVGLTGLSEAIRYQLRESTFTALRHLVQLAIEQEVDFIVISGDVYDSADRSLRAHLRLQEAFEQLSQHGIHVYLIHGNHDPLDTPRLLMSSSEYVHVFGASVGHYIATRRSDQRQVARISGISYPTAKVTENTALFFQREAHSSLFHLAVLHANVDGDPSHETYSPCTRQDLTNSGYDYWALGHIHKRRVLQESPHIVYPGNIQGRHVKETGEKGCYLVEVSEAHTVQLEFCELDTVRWHQEEISIDGIHTEDAWRVLVEERMDDLRKRRAGQMSMVRFVITGRGKVHRLLEEGYVVQELLHEHRRIANERAQRGDLEGLVWIEGFSLQSGMDLDKPILLEEDSFLGELMRLSKKTAEQAELRGEILEQALQPLRGNRDIRHLLMETNEEEQLEWLRRAEELAAVLLLDKEADGGRRT